MTVRPTPERIPPGIANALDYERLAPQALPAGHFAYIAGGSGEDLTARANRAAFGHWAILPRVLRDVRAGHTRLTLNHASLPHPFLLAPVAHGLLAHPQAELASARAAQAAGACLVASTLSSCTLEDIAAAAGPERWFQLYLQPEPAHTLDLLARAEAAGYQAIVLTVDASLQMASRSALAAGFVLPRECVAANLMRYPQADPTPLAEGESRIFQGAMRHAPTWESLHWLLEHTRLPVWVKGVLHPEDAQRLRQAGAAGIVVSNHGGRGLDGSPASLALLPAVRAAVGPGYPVLFDGGVRSGADAFKALALGAQAVLLGRLQLYALAVAGALGVAHMLHLLSEELQATMALAGCAQLSDITPETLMPAPPC
ncbi:alpha-hydroxy acid oxidase [Comamonas flocculans]|uniref:Alpha-hydroxy-acid oxidizing protein n=1 Tax=Comamonas flocculans TaxID=2597701 RepID=A0A5B8RUA5_9BURK|nr:alpha-hydroxy acid oxidase [Comamonas flocculans]QEA13199.1 alpha-hydroxy-acid oxidizing protein [Comamonas flocculans]